MNKFIVLLAVLAAGCGAGGYKADIVTPPANLGNLDAVVVYPFTFRYKYDAYESYEKVQDEISLLVDWGKALVFGPDDFTIFGNKLKSLDPYATTNLLPKMKNNDLDLNSVVAFRGWSEEHVQATQKRAFTSTGKKAGAVVHRKRILVCHLEVIYPATRRLLFEIMGTIVQNPYADPVEWDETPGLTRMHRNMVKSAMKRLGDYFTFPGSMPDPGIDYLVNYKSLFTYTVEGKKTLKEILKEKDMLDREAEIQVRYRYFYPELKYKEITFFQKNPAGLLIKKIHNKALTGVGLQPGDLLLSWCGINLTGPHRLVRAIVKSSKSRTCRIDALRNGKNVSFDLRAKN
ncbi:MAG: hypothetical protein GXP49_01355 [Deltaproteobacteria bacterium]|nr:hypothetical protein [Deltaproteobacteria bacterium]